MAASRLLAGFVLALLATASAPALAVTDEDLLKDDQTTGDVLTYGMGYKAQRYSPLDQISKTTVKRLVPAWTLSFGGEKQRGQESQPIVADGTLYVTASYSRLYAVDARDRRRRSGSTTRGCPTASCPAATSSIVVPRSTRTRSTSPPWTPSSSP